MSAESEEPALRSTSARGPFGGGAWSLGRISGIEIAIDHSWVLIFLLITFSLQGQFVAEYEGWSRGQAWSAALLTSVLFFASILLHELGHSLTAQRLHLRVKSITLFVFGGLAQLDGEPRRPRDEILIALAGPVVSLALGLVFNAAATALSNGGGPETAYAMLAWLGRINVVLAVFNVIPGFPLDGGRVLRGVIWALTGSFETATAVAATSGSFFAYGLIGLGILSALAMGQFIGGLWLAFIGWFLLSAARATVGQMVVERALSGLRCLDAMDRITRACVTGNETVAELAADAVLRHGLRTFYVVDASGRLRGLVTLRELARVPTDERARVRIDGVMVPAERLAVMSPEESAWAALRRMAEAGVNQLPVVEHGRLVGAVTRERLLRLVQARLALQEG